MSSVLKTTPLDSITLAKRLVGFAGPARSGKDTAGQRLIEQGYRHGSFAIHLKRGLAAMLGMSLENIELWKQDDERNFPSLGVKMRYMQQTLGTEWGRQLIDPNFWVFCTAREFGRSDTPMVITDVRFDNEADWIRATGGTVVHLSRTDRKAIDNPEHVSEAGVKAQPGDMRIINDGTVDDLYKSIDAIWEGVYVQ